MDLHSSLANALRDHIGDRTTGLEFPSARGTPLRKSNLLRRSLHPILLGMGKKPSGFHAFRRLRVAHLHKQLVPEILLRVWIGHSTEGITDRYALESVKRDTLFRTMNRKRVKFQSKQLKLRNRSPRVKKKRSLIVGCEPCASPQFCPALKMNSIGMRVKIRSAITLTPCSSSLGSGLEPSFASFTPA